MALNLVIGSEVGGAVAGLKKVKREVQDVTLNLKDQKAILRSLQTEYSLLSTEQARGSIGKALKDDIKVANEEIKRLSVGSSSAFATIGTGATKAFSSVRQLAYILPGIGIAGIFSLAFEGVGKLIGGLFDLNKELSASEIAAEAVGKAYDDAFSSTQGSIAKVQALAKAATDSSSSFDTQKRAIAELKKISKDYFGDLEAGKSSYQQITTAVDNYTQSLIQNAIVQGLEDEIKSLAKEIRQSEKDFVEASIGAQRLQENLTKLKEKSRDVPTGIASVNTEVVYAQTAFDAASSKSKKLEDRLSKQKLAFKELTDEINNAVTGLLKFTKAQGDASNPPPPEKDKETRFRPGLLGRAELIVSPVFSTKGKPLTDAEKSLSEFYRELGNSPAAKGASEAFKGISEAFKEQLNSAVSLAENINTVLGPAFSGLFDSFKDGKNAIDGFFKGLIKGIVQTIEKMVALAAVSGIASAITGIPFKDIFKGLSGIGKRATGGPVGAGQPYMVGETGRELFIPSTNGRIVPNGSLSGIAGSANQLIQVQVDGKISMRDIVLGVARELRHQGKNV